MMENSPFSREEKRADRMKRHIKSHWLEYVLDVIGPLVCTMVLLRICHAENYEMGAACSLAYSVGKIVYSLHWYQKEVVDTDIR